MHDPVWADPFSRGAFGSLPQNHLVVDVGCGYGRMVDILDDLGIERYLGVDPAEEQINLARRLHADSPLRTFEVGNIYELGEKYPGRFDGFMLMAVLMHIPAPRLEEAFRSLRKALKVPGTGMFSTPFSTDREEGEVVEVEPGFFLTLHNPDTIRDILLRSGFSTGHPLRSGNMLLGSIETC